jgi:hypothetical protein
VASPANPDLRLTRFLFKGETGATHSGFMPYRNQLSLFRTAGLTDSEVWQIAEQHVEPNRNKSVRGRGDLDHHDLTPILERFSELTLDFDDDPPGHVNLLGWTDDRARNMQIAQRLRSVASIHLRSA